MKDVSVARGGLVALRILYKIFIILISLTLIQLQTSRGQNIQIGPTLCGHAYQWNSLMIQ